MAKHNIDLQKRAKTRFKVHTKDIADMSSEEFCKLIHDLNVHQIELEIQNEELMRAQLEIENQRDKYRELYEFAPIGYLKVNNKGIISELNLKCSDMLGIKRDILVNLSMIDFIKKEDQEIYYRHMKEIMNTGEARFCELQMQRRDRNRTSFHTRLESLPILDSNRNTVGINVTLIDISDMKHAQKESQKQEKLESLGVLAGGIAHDFNNLLGGMFGYIEMAQDCIERNPEAKEYLDMSLMCYSRTKELTQQLLTFAKGGAPVKKPISIEPLIHKAVSIALNGSKCKCDFEIPTKLYACEADSEQINQVFINILLNSKHAMPEGGLLTIKAKNIYLRNNQIPNLSSGKFLSISLIDQGIGIPQHQIDKIFDPYFTKKQTGSGLGLAITYSIIKRHGGTINITSQVGVGTEITIYLPATDMNTPIEMSDLKCNYNGSGRILIMEDEPVLRKVTTIILTKLGYTVEIAEKGEIALNKYLDAMNRNEKFDAIILDLTIVGGVGGEKTMQKILEIDPKARGIVVSGYSDSPILANPKKYGFLATIAKPFRKKKLGKVLHEVLKV